MSAIVSTYLKLIFIKNSQKVLRDQLIQAWNKVAKLKPYLFHGSRYFPLRANSRQDLTFEEVFHLFFHLTGQSILGQQIQIENFIHIGDWGLSSTCHEFYNLNEEAKDRRGTGYA